MLALGSSHVVRLHSSTLSVVHAGRVMRREVKLKLIRVSVLISCSKFLASSKPSCDTMC